MLNFNVDQLQLKNNDQKSYKVFMRKITLNSLILLLSERYYYNINNACDNHIIKLLFFSLYFNNDYPSEHI